MLAERWIRCKSNGDLVRAILEPRGINRVTGEVIINIPEYNARFIFTRGVNKRGKDFAVIKEPDGRQPINDKEAILHVRQTVYQKMAEWAWAILIAPREIKIPEV